MTAELSGDLVRHLPDAEIEVLTWSAASDELVLRVRKEIGPEVGTLRFRGVYRVNIPSKFTISGLEARKDDSAEAATTFVIHEAWGDEFQIVAEGVEYHIEPNA